MESANIIEKYTNREQTDINDIPILLIELEKYLNLILHDNSWFRQKRQQKEQHKEQILETINTLTKYMNIIHDYYNKISYETISDNIDINYYFVDTMTNAIIIFLILHHIMDVFKTSYKTH